MKVLKLSGTPRQIGRAHGEALRESARELAEIRKKLVIKYLVHLPGDGWSALLRRQVEALKQHADLYEEFEGIREGANLSQEDLILLNNYTDLRDFGAKRPEKSDGGGCSVFAVHTGKSVLCGQTWDMHASAREHIAVIEIESADGGAQRVLTVSGCLGLAGVNASGVCVLINNLHSHETYADGLIWPGLVRKTLAEKSAREADLCLQKNHAASGRNFLICDAGRAIDREITGRRTSLINEVSAPGFVFHTNHYVGELGETEILELQSKTTHARFAALAKYFPGIDPSVMTLSALTQDLFYGECSKTICIPGRKPEESATCGGLIVDLAAREGEMFGGLHSENDRYSFRF